MDTDPIGSPDRFSLVAGGPFHAFLRRLGLIGEDQLPLRKAGISIAIVAWLLPALLAVVQSLFDDTYSGWGYFTDLTVYARFLIAIAVMVATERHADARLGMLARQFRNAKLIEDEGLAGFGRALEDADRRSSSGIAEAVLAAAALAWSGFTARFVVELAGSSWEGRVAAGDVVLSWAGVMASYVSSSLFLFLVLRWTWRFLLWCQLLFRISRLPLRLTPLHPDRSAGLGFLTIYPTVFSGVLFALSCVVASSFLKDLSLVEHSSRAIWFAVGGWLAISVGLVLGPLFVFSRQLYLERERALLEYGRLGSHHHLAFQGKWIEGDLGGEGLLGDPDISSAADLNASIETVERMRIVPVDRATVLGLLTSAGAPMLAVVATEIPLLELFKWIAGAIF
jgi:hypothetical protein